MLNKFQGIVDSSKSINPQLLEPMEPLEPLQASDQIHGAIAWHLRLT